MVVVLNCVNWNFNSFVFLYRARSTPHEPPHIRSRSSFDVKWSGSARRGGPSRTGTRCSSGSSCSPSSSSMEWVCCFCATVVLFCWYSIVFVGLSSFRWLFVTVDSLILRMCILRKCSVSRFYSWWSEGRRLETSFWEELCNFEIKIYFVQKLTGPDLSSLLTDGATPSTETIQLITRSPSLKLQVFYWF